MAYNLFYHQRHRHALWPTAILISGVLFPMASTAAYNDAYMISNEYRDEVVNDHGQLYVHGSLTESPCQLTMESMSQLVDVGNLETADFKKIGSQGKPVPFKLELIDCIDAPTALINRRTNTVSWSTDQTGVKVRFVSPAVPFYPELIKLNGIEGIGLQLSDDKGNVLPLGQNSAPQVVGPGQGTLSYYLTPIRVSDSLRPGAYNALVSFELVYD
ncbi:fimbrial protein [uncultured Cedecea sp.]|uniref:fimbrial protein n=1 Tax=uncultured Cedecea sp. TaxID=988762 RepID=UPI0026106784|nr:fimbrial protein [uncultured Cedecea sp.]